MTMSSRQSIRELRFQATEKAGDVTALLLRPRKARSLLVFGHGAGAGMRHPFMEAISTRLAHHRIATFRYQFPYMETGRKAPDPPATLIATVRSAIAAGARATRDLPVFAGGKSMGGRMTSLAVAEWAPFGLHGLVFFGFPLHRMGQTSAERAAHLTKVSIPMLFLQGTRDKLASLDALRPACKKLGRSALLHVVEGADHSFHMLKRCGRSDQEVLDELGDVVARWMGERGG